MKRVTVKELIAILQSLTAQGKGDFQVKVREYYVTGSMESDQYVPDGTIEFCGEAPL